MIAERKLMRAVFVRAIQDYHLRGMCNWSGDKAWVLSKSLRDQDEARKYLLKDQPEYVFSASSVCRAMNWDLKKLREYVRKRERRIAHEDD